MVVYLLPSCSYSDGRAFSVIVRERRKPVDFSAWQTPTPGTAGAKADAEEARRSMHMQDLCLPDAAAAVVTIAAL